MGASEGRPRDADRRRNRAQRRALYAPGVRTTGRHRPQRGEAARLRDVAEAQRAPAQGCRICGGHAVAKENRRAARRRHLRADGRHRRSGRPLFLRRAARVARAESGARRRTPGRPGSGMARGARARACNAQPRAIDQHHQLSGRGFLRAREREVHSGRRGNPAPLRRSRSSARHRRARSQHLRLHERLRPPPCGPHRHPRRR